MTKKKIAVLVATYNGEEYIEQQINSILFNILNVNNDYDVQILVSDDSSTDLTASIIDRICESSVNVVKFIDGNRKGGVRNNFLYLIQNVPDDIDYIFFSDQDDFWLPNKLKTFLEHFNDNDEQLPLLIHSDLTVVDEELYPIHSSMFTSQKLRQNSTFGELLLQNNVTGCVMAVNKTALNIIKNADITASIMHDWYIALYIHFYGKTIFINKSTILYRQHANNQVGAKKIELLSALLSWGKFRDSIKKGHGSLLKVKKQAILFYNENCESSNPEIKNLQNFITLFDRNCFYKLTYLPFSGFKKKGVLRNLAFFFIFVFGRFKEKR